MHMGVEEAVAGGGPTAIGPLLHITHTSLQDKLESRHGYGTPI